MDCNLHSKQLLMTNTMWWLIFATATKRSNGTVSWFCKETNRSKNVFLDIYSVLSFNGKKELFDLWPSNTLIRPVSLLMQFIIQGWRDKHTNHLTNIAPSIEQCCCFDGFHGRPVLHIPHSATYAAYFAESLSCERVRRCFHWTRSPCITLFVLSSATS